MRNKQLAQIIENMEQNPPSEQDTMEEYKTLNDKCEIVVKKIRNRKNKKNPVQL